MIKQALREWFLYEGRIGRLGFLWRWVAAFIGLALPAIGIANQVDPLWAKSLILAALGLPFLWIFFGLQIRRVHDMSRAGWWIAIPWLAVMLLSWLEYSRGIPEDQSPKARLLLVPWWLFLLLTPGKPEPNRFGPPPS